MAEKKVKWTEQQKKAIDARGGDVVVAASAGTGKTAVLSGRCVSIVSDKSLCPDIRNVLVLTFTEAAAEQMRSRIAGRLKEAFQENRDPHLRRQLVLLQGADISTIHAFCKRLITEYFYELDLDPTFSVIDSDEQTLLKSEVLERTIDWAWQQSGIRTALEQLFRRRDIRSHGGFPAQIVKVSDFLDGVISRECWYERARRLANAANPCTADLGQKQKQIVAEKLRHILAQMQYAIELYENESTGGNWAAKWNETFVWPLTEYVELIESGHWEKFSCRVRDYQRPSRFEYKPRGLSGLVSETIRNLAENARKSFDGLSDLAILNPDYVDRLGDSVRSQTAVLIELVKTFDRLYAQAKRSINCMDFADLEHYALRLLTDPDSAEDAVLPSQTALALRRRYRHIFVDEYQDINSVQQAILEMLSAGANTLGVGDVKQSIYAFRGAEPDIFLQRLRQTSAGPSNAREGLRVDLTANFRSAKGILDFVNRMFSRIMTASSSMIDYDESARLKPGLPDEGQAGALEGEQDVVEFHILDETCMDDDSANDQHDESDDIENLNLVTTRQHQAAMIARRIRKMVGADGREAEFQIHDRQLGRLRDVQYRDIVVLMRSLAQKANDYVEIFRLAGVPVSCQATAGYFEATEITDLAALLKVLDNPQRDIECAAVLRSPFFKISDTELAKIRIGGQQDPSRCTLYDCLLRYCHEGTDAKLAGKLRTILARMEQWRTAARRGGLADLIWRIYRETGFLSFVSALPSGQARRANLLKLHDRAIQFEGFAGSGGAPSLARFVEFIEKIQEIGQDWAPAEPPASAGNAVRILSVHKSKGLEFPVVFLAELQSKFNKTDIQADCLADADDTLGLQIIDRRSGSKLSSLAHQVIAEQKFTTALAEEMRILYVATTRARDRLVLTASQKQKTCGQAVSNGFLLGDRPVRDWQLRSCRNPLQWVLYGLSGQAALHEAFGTGLAERAANDGLFKFELHSQAELRELSEFVTGLKSGKSSRRSPGRKEARASRKAPGLLAQVKKSLAWGYPFGAAPCMSAKSSVTQLTHDSDEFAERDYERALERRPRAMLQLEPQPCEPSDARLIGTATHLVISELDIAGRVTKEAIEETVARLTADGAIVAAVAEQIDTASILAFFKSEQGAWVLDPSNTVWREWPFTYALSADEWENSGCAGQAKHETQETIVVQGIVDMLIRTTAGLVVMDFKTDRVTAERVQERAEFYRRQLELYSKAASAILNAELVSRWLYFLAPRVSVKV
ncbi:MAG: helicase-exonuclease AddAB subunit AddA [Phycisphaerales bacterium]|nr:MAG: helicase-exonuclease AddAB subunit AddA [Phycisphaerales bacterium]